MDKKRVAITGLGCVCPCGNNVKDAWNNIVNGVSGIDYITQFSTENFPIKIAGIVKDFSPEDYMEVKQVKKVDYFTQYTIAAGKQAMVDAKLDGVSIYDPERMGCILGIGMGGLPVLEKYYDAYKDGGAKKISPFMIPALISNLAAGYLGIEHGLKGTNYIITSACASSTHAIGEAYRMIRDGVHDVMLTGGAESTITPTAVGGFAAMKALSTRNDEPKRASRPFDADRDGFVMGEGGIVIVLEEYEKAKERGANIYAEVVGYGYSCDAYHITAPSKDGEGAIACIRMALESANINKEEVDYINAHGTSTKANDETETLAIKEVFKEHAYNLSVSSTKSMTGHLLGAAGAIEALFCTLAIKDSIVPPTINYENKDPMCDLDYTPNKFKEKKIRYALSNSFGFGGTNASIILKNPNN
ncbi:MAG: beta-ketoacyl-ACP synthase II [Bdellovibrionota bacterium]